MSLLTSNLVSWVAPALSSGVERRGGGMAEGAAAAAPSVSPTFQRQDPFLLVCTRNSPWQQPNSSWQMQEGEFFFILLFQESSYLFSSKESIGQELGNSFARNIRIKEEPLDDEYDKALALQQGLLDKIKDEPDNSEVSFPLHFSFWSDS